MVTKALAWFSLVVSKYLFLGELYWEDTELMLPNAHFLECAWQAHTLREELADAVGAGENAFIVKSFFTVITARMAISRKALNWVNS